MIPTWALQNRAAAASTSCWWHMQCVGWPGHSCRKTYHTWIILPVTEDILSLIPLLSVETAIRAKLDTKMAMADRSDMAVAPNIQAAPFPLACTLYPPPAHPTPPAIKTTNTSQLLRLWDTYLHLCWREGTLSKAGQRIKLVSGWWKGHNDVLHPAHKFPKWHLMGVSKEAKPHFSLLSYLLHTVMILRIMMM